MFDAASLPIAAREKLAATIRLEDVPGPRRVALIRDLGLVPLASDGEAPKSAPAVSKKEPRETAPGWDAFAASVRASLVESDARLSLWIPRLRLASENVIQRGTGDESAIRTRHAAKSHSLLALMQTDLSGLHRFRRRVRIEVWQIDDKRTVDPGNLYAKSLVDALLVRGDGLGIIADDSRKFVSFVGTGYRADDGQGVGVVVEMRVEGAT